MKALSVGLVGIAVLLMAVAAEADDLRPVDSDRPVLQYFAPKPVNPTPDHPKPGVTFNPKEPLITIMSLRSLIVQPDGKGVTAVLNEDDTKKYSEITHRFEGGLLICMGDGQMLGIGKITTPTDDGIIEFSEARGSSKTAEYLRRRFGK
jgi:hypothetical protein